MKVFKFGGASVKDADSVRNLLDIILKNIGYELVIVVSAMGKMTNALERICDEFFHRDGDIAQLIQSVVTYHRDICLDLFGSKDHQVFNDIELIFERIKSNSLKIRRSGASYDFLYDQIISEGEMLSATIVSHVLKEEGVYNHLLDARRLIITDDVYREATVLWPETEKLLKDKITFSDTSAYVIQGFIGSNQEGMTTTLGREGSDFTAGIIGSIMEAEEVVIWKDVPGLLNADPKYFSNTKKLNNISYHEAIELAYYGATVIHPKTIKPLQNKGIPLVVKSFKEKNESGSLINEHSGEDSLIPSYIFKSNQVLFSIFTRDYSFVNEKVLSELFGLFASLRIKINLMENSAIGFTACFDYNEKKLKSLNDALRLKYKVLYNKGVELMTIRHYDQDTFDRLVVGKDVLLEQKSRQTARIVMQDKREIST